MSRTALGRAIVVSVYREARAENLTFMAGSVAYHAFVSLLPFLLVLLVAVQAATDGAVARDVVTGIGGYVSPNNGALLADAVVSASASTGLSILGLVTLVWGTLKVFRTLDKAFSDIYETEAANPLADQLSDGVVVLLGVGTAAALAALAGTVVSLDGSGLVGQLVVWVAFVAGLALAFFPIYYVFPDEDVTVREVLPGTIFAAVGWATLESAFQTYATIAGSDDAYGLLGAVLLLVTWLYVSGLVVLLGAAINAVLAGRSEDVDPLPWPGTPAAVALANGGTTTRDRDAALLDELTDDAHSRTVTDLPSADLVALADALETAEHATVVVDGREYSLPRPTTADAETTTVARPGFFGGPEARAELRVVWTSEER